MTTDEQSISDLLAARAVAIAQADAEATVATTAPGAVIYDLQPPLAYIHDRAAAVAGLNAWFANWEGPISFCLNAPTILVSEDLAVAHGFSRLQGVSKSAGLHESWFRTTVVLARQPEGWRIVHEHSSYPTRMDGSGLSAIDLKPE